VIEASATVLDEAFDRVSALDFEIPNPFVNHGPMACEALSVLGYDPVIHDWVERFEANMDPARQRLAPPWSRDFEWEARLGDHRLLPEWMGYFERAIGEEGWQLVAATWVPRLMPGLVSALFHGVIRTSHAVRAILTADTPARRSELARALGNWAVWFGPGQRIETAPPPGDPALAVLGAAAVGARHYVETPTIFNLHGVTGAMAVHLLCSHIAPADAAVAVRQIQAEHQALYAGRSAAVDDGSGGGWDDAVTRAAARSYDPHQVKMVEPCRRGFHLTGDSGFALASRVVTSTPA
jgi:hypothetical protein